MDEGCKNVEEGWVVSFIHVIGIPEAGNADALAVAVMAQPVSRGSIQRRLAVIAEQGDGVALDIAATAGGTRLVVDCKPKKRHRADDPANGAFKIAFSLPDVAWGRTAFSPARTFMETSVDEGCSDNQPENRTPVIAAAAA